MSLAAALAWLDEVEAVGGRIKTPNHHSYWTKHRAEEWSGIYVANGTLILAALIRDVKMQRRYGADAILALPKRAVQALSREGR